MTAPEPDLAAIKALTSRLMARLRVASQYKTTVLRITGEEAALLQRLMRQREAEIERLEEELTRTEAREAEAVSPVPLLLWCPGCGTRHVDEGEWGTRVHHTHACQKCGIVWRPAVVATVGVRFLPGFKSPDEDALLDLAQAQAGGDRG